MSFGNNICPTLKYIKHIVKNTRMTTLIKAKLKHTDNQRFYEFIPKLIKYKMINMDILTF